ncbi:MAG TPA: S8 family serine peptidase [Puia sp.]|nr:S8 family serine peptidase [Puia sp.]
MKTKIVSSPNQLLPAKGFFRLFFYALLSTMFFSPGLALGQQRPSANRPRQPFLLKNGFKAGRNLLDDPASKDSLRVVHYKKNYYTLLQFDKLPGAAERAALKGLGVRLFNYIPDHSFQAEMPESYSADDLKRLGVSGIYPLPATMKISRKLSDNGDEYVRGSSSPIAVSYFGTMTEEAVEKELEQAGATIIPTRIRPEKVLFIRAGGAALQRIAGLPFISYLAPQSLKDQALNYNNRAAHGVDALGNPGGRNLQGDGVTVGVGDDSDPYTHVDFTGRLIERFAPVIGAHGTHTSGTVGGGGILDPKNRGMAPHSTIVSQYFSDVLTNTPTYVSDFHMVLTNNSYTAYDPGCQAEGEYDFLAYYLDAQLYSYPNLLHNFAAGNDGRLSCTPYIHPFATIKSGYQCAKNVLTIGDIDNSNYTISVGSSAGPVNDGRLKPEIVAGGVNILSTLPYNTYGYSSGTSMACPTVTGALALLVQRYRQLQGGADPSAALLKAVTCNSATDLGNPGPDFIFGFGSINARTAVEALENHQYNTGTVSDGGTVTIPLTGIPSGLQQLKVMLYWPDYPAAPDAATALVNDLDLTVTAPDASLHQPLILNPAAGHVNDVAIEGPDHLNNIEQVVINNPPGGNFTITVKGSSIPAGPQSYVVTWQPIRPSVTVEYPAGGETWVPGDAETIRWSAYGGEPNTFTLEYSADNGNTWTTINNAVPATSRLYTWTVPSTATNQGLIRVSRNGTAYTDINDNALTVLGQPVLTATNPCQGYAQLNWTSVPSATSYDIMQLAGDTMQKIASTTGTSWLLGNLRRDSSYWLAIRAVNGGIAGRRSLAANVNPSGGACALTALNNDYTIDSLIAPLTGRLFTTTQLGSSVPIRVELKNLGTIPSGTPFTLSYRVNGGPVVTETSYAVVAPNSTYNYAFTQTYDFSPPGIYTLQLWVSYPGDPQSGNDTLVTVIKQLNNDPILLSPAYTEGFETAADTTYARAVSGLSGDDRSDFRSSNANGRLRTFINTGFARTGVRCATMDLAHYNGIVTADSLITTYNLSNYTPSDQIWLNFYYRNAGINFGLPGNQVWIRGNDQAVWIPVVALDTSNAGIGLYQAAPSVDVTGILKAATPAQTVSSSFQVKFGEEGYTSTNSVTPDGALDNGYSFDDITLTKALGDIAVAALVTPNLSGICGLSNAETISLKVKNYSAVAATNIPVTYSINGVTVTESIPSVNAFDSVIYHFTRTADLSAYQHYTLSAWVSAAGDNYHSNDTLATVSFFTTPLINSFPYLEGFENSNGYWYTNGVNDSWQWGAPAKTLITKAANGAKCWVTSLTGNYNSSELSYLYSPCFDLSGLTSPVLSFSHIYQTEDNCDCDYHWAEYSTDGVHWIKLGAVGDGTNWYDNTTRQAWQLSNTKWHVSSYDIPVTATSVKFRIVMNSDQATTYEGVGIDDIHIFDKAPVYSGPDITSGLTLPVSGSNWINFDIGGQRVVSINPNGQDLGNTTVKAFINTGAVRNDGKAYYLDRNIVIQAAAPPTGQVAVRYYFLDTEAARLLQATGCPGCGNLPDAYQAGVTQYSSPLPAEEDGTLSNDASGVFHYLSPHREVSVIPYDNGYYAQYQVDGFSEFWINASPGIDIGLAALTAPNTSAVCGLSNTEVVRVTVKNYSDYNLTNIPVHYSLNGDTVTEVIPAIAASDSVVYTFAQTADLSAFQQYTLKTWVSYGGDSNALNDSLPAMDFQTAPLINSFPYLEGFENSNGYWYTQGVNDSWQWGSPAATIINKAGNGSRAWVTNLTGNYNNNERSYLYSPCYDLSGLVSPMLSFSHIFQMQDNCVCDEHWVEYSTDGVVWTKLGLAGSGTSWYDDAVTQAWKVSDPHWHVSGYAIPVRAADTRFRIVFTSDADTTFEGVGIDGIHIWDSGVPGQIQYSDGLLLSFTAVKTGNQALLQWNTIEETANSRYVIEKSRDSVHFFAIDSLPAVGNRDTVNAYSYTDNKLWAGADYYRLKIAGGGGQLTYSPIRVVNDTTSGLVITVFPNPVEPDGRLYIASSVNCERIQLVDVSGRVVMSVGAHGLLNTLRPGGIARGVYFVRVETEAGSKVVKVFVK